MSRPPTPPSIGHARWTRASPNTSSQVLFTNVRMTAEREKRLVDLLAEPLAVAQVVEPDGDHGQTIDLFFDDLEAYVAVPPPDRPVRCSRPRVTVEAMKTNEEIHDSPAGWVAEHIEQYVSTEGEEGHRWRGTNTLLLTTRGRRTGRLRRTALIYGKDGDDYVVVASKGGAPDHPSWYYNLRAEPRVSIQVGADEMEGSARTATGDERERLWKTMTSEWPDYDDYQDRTERDIPVVVIETD